MSKLKEFIDVKLPLAFDFGAYDGKDTLFLLKHGYKVVSVEANIKRFYQKIKPLAFLYKEICAENACIALTDGKVSFYLSSTHGVWDSCHPEIAERQGPSQKVEVGAVTVLDMIDKYGCPQYLKCDIEGNDIDVLCSLKDSAQLPKYMSCESECQGNNYDSSKKFEVLDQMKELGYSKFFLVDNFKDFKNEIQYDPKQIVDWMPYSVVKQLMLNLSEHYAEKNGSPQLWADIYCCS